jgi:hypothetical protein
MRWVEHVARMVLMRRAHKIFVKKPQGKRPLGGPRRRREYNTKMSLKEIEGELVDWTRLAQNINQWRALMTTVMILGFYKRRGIS